jgi:hypothetical protein
VATAASLALAFAGASPASATTDLRVSAPVMAGSLITYGGTRAQCTAGAVLTYDGYLGLISAKDRATRYILTAGHCGTLHQGVIIGRTTPGTVTWVSPDSDLELITVEPEVHVEPRCDHSSLYGSTCYVANRYTPRAVGRVALTTAGSPGERDIPMQALGTPGADETFCSSGQVTLSRCVWRFFLGRETPFPSRFAGVVRAVTGPGNGVRPGDSGGPVVDRQGTLYGIIATSQSVHAFDLLGYTPIRAFFRQQPGYALAPATTG